jgi:hypothetical protein
MVTPEVGSSGEENQALIRTRERLGKPVFLDQKKGRKQAFQLVSRTIEGFLQIGEKLIEEEMRGTISSHREEQVTITPAYLALQHCFKLSEQIQHRALRNLVGDKKENRPLDIAALDVIKGFQLAMNALNVANNPILQGKMPSYPVINSSGGLIESYEDPKLIVAGVKLGAKTYRKMRPIAERVLSASH